MNLISTPRLLIRKFREEDAPALYAYLSNPLIYRFEPGETVTLAEARQIAHQRALGPDFWAVALNDSEQLVGHLYFSQIEPPELLTWELGYIFNPDFQNRGYATEAAAALVGYGFAHWSIHRVVAHCNPENTASWRVMEKIGMQREGYFRQNIFFQRDAKGEPIWLDTFEYAILQTDGMGG